MAQASRLVKTLGAKLRPLTSVKFRGAEEGLSNIDPFLAGFGESLFIDVPSGPRGAVDLTVTTARGTSTAFLPFSTFTYL